MGPIDLAKSWIRSANSVAVLSGAGISAESGVPTFPGVGGLWRGRDAMSLARPTAFQNNPELVGDFYNDRRNHLMTVEPNPGHLALAHLARAIPHFHLVTQNVDRLHQRAGSFDVIELHGNIWDVLCVGCGETFDKSGIPLDRLPTCDQCGSLLRPAVVWFGEAVPEMPWRRATLAIETSEILIVVGTSGLVQPAAGLASLSQQNGRTVIEINLEHTEVSPDADLTLIGPAGTILPRLASAIL